MKPRQPLLALLLLALLLTACTGQNWETRALDPVSPASAPASAPEETGLIYTVELVTRTGAATDGDGLALATYNYELPEMKAVWADGGERVPVTAETARNAAERQAAEVAETFNREFRQWQEEADFDTLAEQARADRALLTGTAFPGYHQALEGTQVYQEGRLVSVSGTFYYFGGGAHPNTVSLCWNFDTQTGAFFTAGQLFDDPETITEELRRQARGRAAAYNLLPEEFFWPDYAEILAGWEDATVAFDAENMTVFYSPYDIASYAAGPQVFTIPRLLLSPYLSAFGRGVLGLEFPS